MILVVLSIAFMIMDTRMPTITHVRTTVSITLLPLQYVVSWPIKIVHRLTKIVTTQDALLQENQELKAQQLLLRTQVQRLLAIESENNQLKALMRTSATVQGKVLIGELLAVDVDPFVHQVILDKGTRDQLYVGQPVLDANGVMGKVISAGLFTSRVLLVNDPHSGVPVQDTRNGIRAIAVGDTFSGKLRLVNIPQTVDIKEGDILVTSGLGEDYPEGYPLGYVVSVIKDSGQQFASITVEPNARLDRAREVLLVWPNTKTPEKTTEIKNEDKKSASVENTEKKVTPIKKSTSDKKIKTGVNKSHA